MIAFSTGGSGGYHSSGSRGTSQVKLSPLNTTFGKEKWPKSPKKVLFQGGRGSGESRKSGHSAESDAGVVRQANVFIRWAGGGHWDLLMLLISILLHTLPIRKGGGHRDLLKMISQKEVLHSRCCIRSVL